MGAYYTEALGSVHISTTQKRKIDAKYVLQRVLGNEGGGVRRVHGSVQNNGHSAFMVLHFQA